MSHDKFPTKKWIGDVIAILEEKYGITIDNEYFTVQSITNPYYDGFGAEQAAKQIAREIQTKNYFIKL